MVVRSRLVRGTPSSIRDEPPVNRLRSYVGESRSHDALRRLALANGSELKGWLRLGDGGGGFCLA